jgi:hypothetical protein
MNTLRLRLGGGWIMLNTHEHIDKDGNKILADQPTDFTLFDCD